MMALIIKELRQLSAIAWLIGGIVALGVLVELITSRIDEASFYTWCSGYCDYGMQLEFAMFDIVLLLIAAYSLYPREQDEATLDFLHALPTSRVTVFFAKFLAAWLLVNVLVALGFVASRLLLQLNPQSIDGRYYPQIDAMLMLRYMVFSFVILAHGVLLSYFRTLGLIAYLFYLLVVMFFEVNQGSVGAWSIFDMLRNDYVGQSLLLEVDALLIHAGVAAVVLLWACRLWTRSDSRTVGQHAVRRRRTWLSTVCAVMMFVFVSGLMLVKLSGLSETGDDAALLRHETDHYRFVYRAGDTDKAAYVFQYAEADYRQLSELLGSESDPVIQVDMSANNEHAAGLAKWKKIQMDLSDFQEDTWHRRVLSHETAHVFQAVESNRGLSEAYNATRFFIEGMAQFVSFDIVPQEARRSSNWSLAAMAQHRQRIRFEHLSDNAAFSKRFDPELYYSVGDVWTDALVSSCGLQSLGDLLRYVGSDDSPGNLPSTVFWRNALQSIGCELEDVNEEWRRLLESELSALDDANFPEFADVVFRRDPATDRILIEARLVPTTRPIPPSESSSGQAEQAAPLSLDALPDRFHVRIGSETQVSSRPDQVYSGTRADTDTEARVRFSLPASAILEPRFRYQLGFTPVLPDPRNYFAPWRRGSFAP